MFKEILADLKNHFVFKDHLLQHVDKWKESIINEKRKKTIFVGKPQALVFSFRNFSFTYLLGVHCRRTDFKRHYSWVSNGTLVDHRFFDAAFDIYRRRYNDDRNQVIFLTVSDDIAWIRDNLGRHSDVRFGDEYSKTSIQEEDLVGFDLAVLATSDHSIHTVGYCHSLKI